MNTFYEYIFLYGISDTSLFSRLSGCITKPLFFLAQIIKEATLKDFGFSQNITMIGIWRFRELKKATKDNIHAKLERPT